MKIEEGYEDVYADIINNTSINEGKSVKTLIKTVTDENIEIATTKFGGYRPELEKMVSSILWGLVQKGVLNVSNGYVFHAYYFPLGNIIENLRRVKYWEDWTHG